MINAIEIINNLGIAKKLFLEKESVTYTFIRRCSEKSIRRYGFLFSLQKKNQKRNSESFAFLLS